MVLLDSASARYVRSWLGEPKRPGVLDLYHALGHHRRGIWGDDARAPHSILLIREGDGQLDAFGAGDPEPALSWLSRRAGRTVALLGPPEWREAVGRRFKPIERSEILTLTWQPQAESSPIPPVVARRLVADDFEAFRKSEATPPWALFAWNSFAELIKHGAAFAVDYQGSFIALAWIYSQTDRFDAIAVSTVPKYRGLGLGKAVASALLTHVVSERGKFPIWTTASSNEASQGLAESLGFAQNASETLLRFCPVVPSPKNVKES